MSGNVARREDRDGNGTVSRDKRQETRDKRQEIIFHKAENGTIVSKRVHPRFADVRRVGERGLPTFCVFFLAGTCLQDAVHASMCSQAGRAGRAYKRVLSDVSAELQRPPAIATGQSRVPIARKEGPTQPLKCLQLCSRAGPQRQGNKWLSLIAYRAAVSSKKFPKPCSDTTTTPKSPWVPSSSLSPTRESSRSHGDPEEARQRPFGQVVQARQGEGLQSSCCFQAHPAQQEIWLPREEQGRARSLRRARCMFFLTSGPLWYALTMR